MPPTDVATEAPAQESPTAAVPRVGDAQSGAQRFARAVGSPHEHGFRGGILVLLTGAAVLWFGWQAGRGFWRGDQEWQVSAIQAALAVLFVWLTFAVASFWSSGLVTGIVVLLVAGEMAVEAAITDRSRMWIAGAVVAVCLLLIHYLVVRRADFGHRTVIQPFQPAVPAEPGLMDWLTGASSRQNVLIAIHNAVALADRITDLPPLALSEVARAGGYRLDHDLASERAWMYRAYLAHYLADGTLGDDDAAQLGHLSKLLYLPGAAVDDAHRKVGGELYREKVKAATADNSLDAGEKAELAALQASLTLPDEEVQRISTPLTADLVARVFDEAVTGGRLDAAGEARVLTAAEQMGAGAVTPALALDIYRARFKALVRDGALTAEGRATADRLQATLSLPDDKALGVRRDLTDALARRTFDEVRHWGVLDEAGAARVLAVIEHAGPGAVSPGLARDVYQSRLREVAKDGDVAPGEQAGLAELERALGLDEKEARGYREEDFRRVSQGMVDRVLQDGQLTDAEAVELAELGQRLGVNVRDDERTRAVLDRARTIYHVLHGELPHLGAMFNLREGELCHAELQARWVEWDTVESTRYVTTGSVREVPSLFSDKSYLKQESETREVHTTREVKRNLGSGRLFATSQRLVFIGSPNNRSYDYDDLLDVTHGPDSLVLHRDGSTNILFEVGGDVELFAMIVGRALRDA